MALGSKGRPLAGQPHWPSTLPSTPPPHSPLPRPCLPRADTPPTIATEELGLLSLRPGPSFLPGAPHFSAGRVSTHPTPTHLHTGHSPGPVELALWTEFSPGVLRATAPPPHICRTEQAGRCVRQVLSWQHPPQCQHRPLRRRSGKAEALQGETGTLTHQLPEGWDSPHAPASAPLQPKLLPPPQPESSPATLANGLKSSFPAELACCPPPQSFNQEFFSV